MHPANGLWLDEPPKPHAAPRNKAVDADAGNTFRGILIGLALSVVLWVAFIWVISRLM